MKNSIINFGSYIPEDAERIKIELEKLHIPVELVYPGTRIGRESTGGARYSAYTIFIPSKDYAYALEIRRMLNISTLNKLPLPRFIYSRINRYIIGTALFLWMIMIVSGSFSIGKLYILSLILIFISILVFGIINSINVFIHYSSKRHKNQKN